MNADYQLQDFETGVLGVPVGKLSLNGTGEFPAKAVAGMTAAWQANGVWLVSSRVIQGSEAVSGLENAGFRSVETLATFLNDLSDTTPQANVTLAEPEDYDGCLAVAKRAFTNDRLHQDPEVPDEAADLVREHWVLNNLKGRGDTSFVVRVDGEVAGFNLCLLRDDEAVIDLIAVDTGHRKKGLGRALVEAAKDHYQGQGLSMRVGTQADNGPSIALYLGAGFVEQGRQTTLHWINRDATAAPTLSKLSQNQ